MDDGSRFCSCCGAEVKHAGGHKKKKRKKRRYLTVILTMILLVLSGLTGVGIFLIKEQLQTNPTDQISEELTAMIEPYLNDNGVFDDDPDQLTKAAEQVYAYAQSLEEKGYDQGIELLRRGIFCRVFPERWDDGIFAGNRGLLQWSGGGRLLRDDFESVCG